MLEAVCVNSVLKQEYTVDHKCHTKVPVPCEETKITAHPMSTVYPSSGILRSLLRQFNMSSEMQMSEFRSNFLSVSFYMTERKMTHVHVNRKMSWIDLFNQAGGTIGMCLGMSIMSFMELVMLFYYGTKCFIIKLKETIGDKNLHKVKYFH